MKLVKFWNNQWRNRQSVLLKHNRCIQKDARHLTSGEKSFLSTVLLSVDALVCLPIYAGKFGEQCWHLGDSAAVLFLRHPHQPKPLRSLF